MDNSPLVKLPAELRNRIWEYVLVAVAPVPLKPVAFVATRRTIGLDLQPKDRRISPQAIPFVYSNILLTCKAICYETHQLLYAANRFVFIESWDFDPQRVFQVFTALIGERNAAALRDIEFVIWDMWRMEHLTERMAAHYCAHVMVTLAEARKYPQCVIHLAVKGNPNRSLGPRPNDPLSSWKFVFDSGEADLDCLIKQAAAGDKEKWAPALSALATRVESEYKKLNMNKMTLLSFTYAPGESAPGSDARECSLFETLPAELRDQIWEHALIIDGSSFIHTPLIDPSLVPIGRSDDRKILAKYGFGVKKLGVGLLQTCKAIYCEAHPHLYKSNRFTFFGENANDDLRLFTTLIGTTAVAALRNVTFLTLYEKQPRHIFPRGTYFSDREMLEQLLHMHVKSAIVGATAFPRVVLQLVVSFNPWSSDMGEWNFKHCGAEGDLERAIEKAAARSKKVWKPALAAIHRKVLEEFGPEGTVGSKV